MLTKQDIIDHVDIDECLFCGDSADYSGLISNKTTRKIKAFGLCQYCAEEASIRDIGNEIFIQDLEERLL